MRKKHTNAQWFSKACAGLVLGFLLSMGLGGLLLTYGFGEIHIYSIRGQFLMWMIAPVWLFIFSLCFLFHTGLQAFVYLGIANVLVWSAMFSQSRFLT